MIKEKDFIEIEYTGIVKEINVVFDTSDEKLSKERNIYNPRMTYGPLVICVGESNVIKGFDNDFLGKEVGQDYTVLLPPEKAFGKKDGKLLKIVPMSVFKKADINPTLKLQVNIDGMIGVIKNVSGGRTVVDFNHPLSGKEIIYNYKINRVITDVSEKIKYWLILVLNCKPDGFNIKLDGEKVEVELKKGVNLDDNAKTILSEKLVSLIAELKEVSFKDE